MLLDFDWLKQFIEPKLSPEELGEAFHDLGFSLESVTDNLIDLEITPNRGDLQSIYGLAREYAASIGQRLDAYRPAIEVDTNTSEFVTFSPKATSALVRYSYLIARGGKVQASPDRIAHRLKRQGLNPKNNIIDLTNYLMYECGQPIHAFDISKIHGINIDFAGDGQTAVLLNGNTVNVGPDNLVAYDNGNIIDLVCVSGCEIPAVSADTTDILIQAAIFQPEIIRQSSKSANVKTPASYRYERGIDVTLTLQSLLTAKEMLENYGFTVDIVADIYPGPRPSHKIEFDYSRIPKLLGFDIDKEFANKALYNLGIDVDGNVLTIPSWRDRDMNIEEDVIEEILRIYGYDKIPAIELPPFSYRDLPSNVFNENLKTILAEAGMTEIISSTFISTVESKLSNCDLAAIIEIANPISDLNRYLRPNLKLKMIAAVAVNPWLNDIALYEIGNVFARPDHQTNMLGIISTQPINGIDGIDSSMVFETLGTDLPVMMHYKLRRKLYYLEIPVESIRFDSSPVIKLTTNRYRPISKFPPVIMDIAVIVDDTIQPSEIEEFLYSQSDTIIIAETFDEFVSDRFGAGKKSLAIHIIYQDLKATPQMDDIASLHDAVKSKIISRFNATIR